MNDSLGGYEGFMHLKQEGAKYNANVSVNVNYDDAYKSSPQFDPAFIARRPDGELWESRRMVRRNLVHCWLGKIYGRADGERNESTLC